MPLSAGPAIRDPLKRTAFESLCMANPHSPGLISQLYLQLVGASLSLYPTYVTQWEKELGAGLNDGNWSGVWLSTARIATMMAALETNYKLLLSWYLVPEHISKAVLGYPSSCFRGCPDGGSQAHIWWTCPMVRRFWLWIRGNIDMSMGVFLDAYVFLFNYKPDVLHTDQFRLLQHVLTSAKGVIAKHWKSPSLPGQAFFRFMSRTMFFEKLTAQLEGTMDKFELVWQPWADTFLSSSQGEVIGALRCLIPSYWADRVHKKSDLNMKQKGQKKPMFHFQLHLHYLTTHLLVLPIEFGVPRQTDASTLHIFEVALSQYNGSQGFADVPVFHVTPSIRL